MLEKFCQEHPTIIFFTVVLSVVTTGGAVSLSQFVLASRDYVNTVVDERSEKLREERMEFVNAAVTDLSNQMRCDIIEIKYVLSQAELFRLGENEKSEPTKDRRKRIQEVEASTRFFESAIDKCRLNGF